MYNILHVQVCAINVQDFKLNSSFRWYFRNVDKVNFQRLPKVNKNCCNFGLRWNADHPKAKSVKHSGNDKEGIIPCP